MSAYVTTTDFALRTLLPQVVLDDIESSTPGWLAAQITLMSEHIDSRLRKRYQAPFDAPYPSTVVNWVIAIISYRAYLKRGVSSVDEQFSEYKAQHDLALEELKEAANSEEGLFELPLLATSASAVSKGYPRSYTEQSPYVGFDKQAETGRDEDAAGDGSYR